MRYVKLLGTVCSLMLLGVLIAGVMAAESWAAELWVTNMKSANVQVFNPTTLKLITTIPADKGAHNVTFSPNGKLAFIANVGANNDAGGTILLYPPQRSSAWKHLTPILLVVIGYDRINLPVGISLTSSRHSR
jgi:DNA-binding beta-propeller fold protein YncE